MLDPAGTYHVHSRCVRRAWLCGFDRQTGRDFSHRRAWIERRIRTLSDIFAVSVYSYAILNNHYHIVMKLEPDQSADWTDEEIVDRWLTLCPGRRKAQGASEALRQKKATLLSNPATLAELRARLTSLSWFMRFINEPLARRANKEDDCTGRFWEGRFKSQLLLDETALLACMAYVDLNPVRAGIAESIPDSDFTSIAYRLKNQHTEPTMRALGGTPASSSPFQSMPVSAYLDVLHWTLARHRAPLNEPQSHPPLSLQQQGMNPTDWFTYYLPRPRHWRRAVGSAQALKTLAKAIGQHWIRRWSPLPGH